MRWRMACPEGLPDGEHVAAVCAPAGGFLAAMESGDGPLLLAAVACATHSVPSAGADPGTIRRAIRLGDGEPAEVDPGRLGEARAAIQRWLAERRAASAAGAEAVSPVRRKIARRISAIIARAAAHRRPALSLLALEARAGSRAALGVGGERELAALLDIPMPDEAWLAAVAAFAGPRTRGAHGAEGAEGAHGAEAAEGEVKVVAILLLQA